MTARRNVLAVLAHQDDEIAIATRILDEVRSGAAVHCVFLTDGSRGGVTAARDEESRAVLTRLGVIADHIHFIGSELPIHDGELAAHLDEALAALIATVGGIAFDAVYTLAWEGGHHDHDAAHLVALAFARERNVLRETWCAPLYHGLSRPGPLFRAMSPLAGGEWVHRRIDRRDAKMILRLTSLYVTQKRTWRALLPGAVMQLLLRARESMQRADVGRIARPPHAGLLYYERRFRTPYATFEALTRSFVARRLT
jgi:hypothetical protein